MKIKTGDGQRIFSEFGFSALEAMLSMVIVGVMAMLSWQCFNAGSSSFDQSARFARLNAEMRNGMGQMIRELRNTSPAHMSLSNLPAGTLIRFQLPSRISPSTVWSANWIEYRLGGASGDQLVRIDAASNQMAMIANKVRNVRFSLQNEPLNLGGQNAMNNVVNTQVLVITMNAQDTTNRGRVIPLTLTGFVDFRNTA